MILSNKLNKKIKLIKKLNYINKLSIKLRKNELINNEKLLINDKYRKYRINYSFNYRYSKNFKRKCKYKLNVMNKLNFNQNYSITKMSSNSNLNSKLIYKLIRKNRNKLRNNELNKYDQSKLNRNLIYKNKLNKHNKIKLIKNNSNISIINKQQSTKIKKQNQNQIKESNKLFYRKQFTYRCLLSLLINLLIGQFLLINNVKAFDTCIEHCTCIYSKNKFGADCSGLALDSLPVVKDEELATKVQILNLTRNAFIKLENELFYTSKMINLQRIYLSKGALQSIGNSTFYKLNNLIELDLSQNQLTIVPKESFHSISKLTILDLSSNLIQTISEFSFHPLKMLKILSLENNQISVIDPKAFLGLAELETLKLSDNQISFMTSESLSPLNKLHTLTLANNRWLCDCKMRQLKEFLINNRRINVLDQPICDNQPQNIWTEISIDSFLCSPRLMSNNSDRVYQVGQGSNLALECSFQVESTLEQQPAVIRWLWENRPIANNSEGVVSSQRFLITEYDYYLTTETTSTPYVYNTTPLNSLPAKTKSNNSSSNNFKFSASNQLNIDDEDGLPLIELQDLNQFHRDTISTNNQANNAKNQQQQHNSDSSQRSSITTTSNPSSNQLHHHSHLIPPFEKHIVKRRIRKSRMEITFILELNQGNYYCEASNQAGSVSLNFTIYVNSVIRRTDFIANNRISTTTADSINENNLVNKRSGSNELSSNSDDALFNELNSEQTANNGQTKHQPLLNLNTSNSVVVGLVLGILFGILLVLAVFSVLIVAICRKKPVDQADLSSSQNSTGCSTENSLLSTLAQVNCLPTNNLQACSIGHHPVLSTSGNTNDWYSNNFSPNNANSASNTLSYTNNFLTTNRNNQHQNNFNNPLALHHSSTMSQFNSSNSLSLLSPNNLYGHCNILSGHDQLLAGHHLINNLNCQTGVNTDLNVMNLESSMEKSELQIYNDDDDLKKSKIA